MSSDESRRWWTAALGLLTVFLFVNLPIATGEMVAVWDADQAFSTWQMLVADFARSGELLLWNPWTNAGSPDFGEPQFGALSPVNVLWGLVAGGSEAAFRFYWLAVWLAGGLGMLVLARRMAAPAWGGFIVGTAFLFSGFMIGHAQHTPFLVAFSALPWMLWRMDVALGDRRLRPALEAGVLWGISALAGYPGVVVAAGGYVVLWAVGRVLIGRDRDATSSTTGTAGTAAQRGGRRADLVFLVAALLLWTASAAVVASPTYLGLLVEGRGYTMRAGEIARELAIGSNAWDPGAVATLASTFPALLQTATDLWAATDVSSSSVYVGALALWLALLALLRGTRRAWRWWILALGLLGLAIAAGPVLPLRGWLYDWFPPTRYFRHSAIFRGWFVLSALVLATLGTRDVAEWLGAGADRPRGGSGADEASVRGGTGAGEEREAAAGARWRRVAGLTGLAVALFASGLYLHTVSGRFQPAGGASFHLLVLSPWIGVALVSLLLLLDRYGRTIEPGGGYLASLPLVVLAGIALAVGDAWATATVTRPIVATSSPAVTESWEWVRRNRSTDVSLPDLDRIHHLPIAGGRTNKHLPAKVPVLTAYAATSNPFHRRWVADSVLSGAVTGRARIWFAPEEAVARAPVTDAAFSALVRRAHEVGGLPVVVHDREAMLGAGGTAGAVGAAPDSADRGAPRPASVPRISSLPPARPLSYVLEEHRPTRLAFRVSAPADGWVVLTDRWARGWEATVDGEDVEVLGADFLFRAVHVEAGSRRLVFTYRPFGHPWLLGASWGLIGIVALSSLGGRAIARPPRRTALTPPAPPAPPPR